MPPSQVEAAGIAIRVEGLGFRVEGSFFGATPNLHMSHGLNSLKGVI